MELNPILFSFFIPEKKTLALRLRPYVSTHRPMTCNSDFCERYAFPSETCNKTVLIGSFSYLFFNPLTNASPDMIDDVLASSVILNPPMKVQAFHDIIISQKASPNTGLIVKTVSRVPSRCEFDWKKKSNDLSFLISLKKRTGGLKHLVHKLNKFFIT